MKKGNSKAKISNKAKGKSPSSNKKVKAVTKKKQVNAKTPTKTSTPSKEVVNSDVDVDEEDEEFFNEHSNYARFLGSMKPSDLEYRVAKKQKKEMPKKEQKRDDDEQDDEDDEDDQDIDVLEKAEAAPRRKAAWAEKKESTKLPIKGLDGSIKQFAPEDEDEDKEPTKDAEEEEDNDQEDDEDEEEQEVDSEISDIEVEVIEDVAQKPVVQKPRSKVDLKKLQARRLAAKKIEMAKLSESILENPEEGLKKNKEHEEGLSKLQELHALCTDEDFTICKYAMLSELAVFQDILPGYRIRLPTEDSSVKLKKAVRQLQSHEASLLSNYQKYLKFLDTTSKLLLKKSKLHEEKSSQTIQQESIARTAVKCLAELLKSKYHFNFSLNLIIALIPFADSQIKDICTCTNEALETVFKSDKSGKTSLEIVRQMTRFIKKRHNRVGTTMLNSLLALHLTVTMAEGDSARKQVKREKRKRRKQEEGDSIAAGLKEAEATVDRSEKQKTEADILHEVVLIYFRILKEATDSPALPAILRGLSKFSPLINLDIMIDLLKLLKVLLKTGTLPLSSSLQAVLTGLRTLQGPGQELMVDEKDFVNILYNLLLQLVEDQNRTCFPTALSCLEALFLRRKEIMVDRVAAFVKRLVMISMYLSPNHMLAASSLVRSLLHKYSKLQQILENDLDRVATGIYRADVDDPDFSNPYASSCWELALQKFHYHPKVASFTQGTAQLDPSLPNENPKAILEKYDVEASGEFKPRLVIPKPNPLHNRLNNKRKSKLKPLFLSRPAVQSQFYLQLLTLEKEPPVKRPRFKGKA